MKQLRNLLPAMLLALLAWNCQKEETNYPELNQETEDNVLLKALTIEQLPDFSGSIKQQSSKMGWASKNNDEDVVLDGSRVLAVTDSVGNTTYSLRMYVTGTPHNVFYNVVGKRTHEGVQREPFVLRYEVDEDYWPEYVAGPRQEKPFKGTIGVYKLEAFGLQLGQNGKMGSEPEPCLTVDANGGNGDGGNGGGGNANNNEEGNDNGGGGNHDPGSYYDYWNMYAPNNGGGAGYDTEPFAEVGQGKFGGFGTDGIWKRALTGKNADCPEEDTLLPINEEDFEEKIDDTALKPCLKTILQDLKTLNRGVGYVLQMFASNTPGFNWEVKDGSLGGATGTTSTKYNKLTGTVTTTFDSQAWGNATDLSWARTMMHESIHSYVVASSYNAATIAQKQALLGPDWASAYLNYGHEYIANNYIKPIADSLQEFGNIKGYHHSRQFYEDMAWAGLHSTSAFNGLPVATQKRINDVILIELTKKDTNGNPESQKGSNAGC
ncbi:hypothetical protein [Allomuricauda sp. F6463D]|uniref:hypothetical protein n=1 Tax=Allomuricauda sp. F6463D TaxID=2926409 RepID=UPI001FF23702|nr:hypothetical protein [Muricauda sp. F6463D]MCK0161314.1 hypothetical protein [Muricauda sp. F6463D]